MTGSSVASVLGHGLIVLLLENLGLLTEGSLILVVHVAPLLASALGRVTDAIVRELLAKVCAAGLGVDKVCRLWLLWGVGVLLLPPAPASVLVAWVGV